MKVHDLKPPPGSKTSRRRVGRGIAGKGGKTAGRGTKGQGARNNIAPRFEVRPGGAAGDHAGTGRGRLQQDARGVVLADDRVRDGVAGERDGEDVLLRLLHALLDRGGHFLRLAVAEPDVALTVADDHERGEGEPPTALDDLGDSVDGDDSLFELAFGHGSVLFQSFEMAFRG